MGQDTSAKVDSRVSMRSSDLGFYLEIFGSIGSPSSLENDPSFEVLRRIVEGEEDAVLDYALA